MAGEELPVAFQVLPGGSIPLDRRMHRGG